MSDGIRCAECSARVDWRRPGVGEFITGIRQNRSGGGANQIIDPKGTGQWLCRDCTEGHKLRTNVPGRGQGGLFK